MAVLVEAMGVGGQHAPSGRRWEGTAGEDTLSRAAQIAPSHEEDLR
jgi:hypothetical protein